MNQLFIIESFVLVDDIGRSFHTLSTILIY